MKDKLLIIRFSALGDVAMAAHLINFIKKQQPDLEVFVLSKPHFYPIFKPLSITTIPVDLKGQHKGFAGLLRLSREISKQKIKYIADIHGVIRSFILDFFLFIFGEKISIINKERRKKKAITRGRDIKIIHTIERYNRVLHNLGINIDITQPIEPLAFELEVAVKKRFIDREKKNIGIAPFAAHKNKEYPLELMEQVIAELNARNDANILIFGGGKREKQTALVWENKYKNVRSVIGLLSLEQEIGLIGQLDLIVTMDSGNMHLASLTKTKNLIIWGGTHPKMGFTPVGNFDENLSIIKNLPCQPCSVFGSGKCKRGDFACLYQIHPQEIVKKIKENT